MTTRYVTKTVQFEVSITWDATELSDAEGAHIENPHVVDIDINGKSFASWAEAVAHMDAAHENEGDWT